MKALKLGSGKSGKIIFAHGAGAPMDSDWMNNFCEELSHWELQTLRFEFPYMQELRKAGKKRPPDRAPILEKTWLEAIGLAKGSPYFLMGKSMGSRIASHIANQTDALGLIALGFPFHAPGKTLTDRHAALLEVKKPVLILQGERDALGSQVTLEGLKLKRSQKIIWLADGDHSLKPRKSSGFTLEDHVKTAAKHIAQFVEKNS